MNKLTAKRRRKELDSWRRFPTIKIDTSDIPELTDQQLRRGIRGHLYRPIKRPVTMRLDADVVEWLKRDGRGYQTKANRLLRTELLRFLRAGKPSQDGTTEAERWEW